MDQELKKNLLAICALLEQFEVRYLLVGGAAVALHGYYRHSMGPSGLLATKPDIDLWYDPTYENYFKIIYRIDGERIIITDIFDSRQDPRNMRI